MAIAQRFTTYRVMRPLKLLDFSGGWNLRDAPSELAENESPDLLNVQLDPRGGVIKRLGYDRIGSGTVLSAAPSNIFYWDTNDRFIVQVGATVYSTQNFVTFTSIHTYSDASIAAFCDFQNRLVAVHPTDKVAVWDGTTWTAISDSPRGNCIAAWQNKVWVSGDPSAVTRVYACNAGDPTVWTLANDYNDMNDKDHLPVTAIGGGQGMDVAGRPGLLVYKEAWTGRINDAKAGTTFGQYTTLSNIAGASGPQAVTTAQNGVTISINRKGIWATNGQSIPASVSDKISPLFRSNQLNYGRSDKWCADQSLDAVVFSISRIGSNVNNLTLEYNPVTGSIVPQGMGFSSFTVYSKSGHELLGASPSEGKVFYVYRGWDDNGTLIASRFLTRWIEPQAGYMVRLRRARVEARGEFTFRPQYDYLLDSTADSWTFDASLDTPLWGHPLWDHFNWTGNPSEAFQDLYSLGVGKAVAFEITENSRMSAFRRKLLEGSTTSEEVGSFAMYSILLDYVRLGYA